MGGAEPRKPSGLSGKLAALAAGNPTGTLRIDRFMSVALYDPEAGYYTRSATIGGQGRDFSTIPTLSPLLGKAVARWVMALPNTRGRGPIDIIEVGAGGGHLAEAVFRGAGWWARRRIRYHIVEISPSLRLAQRKMLGGRKVTWHETVAGAVAEIEQPIVISNELVDAFPCRLLRYERASWCELRLGWPPEGEHPLSCHPLEDLDPVVFSALQSENWSDGEIPDGQIVEIHPSYRQWLKDWVPTDRGLDVLTIDYGDTVKELYKDRPRGSLRGYLSHQRLTGGAVFRAPGKIDLTCDVNFTDLENWGRECGLHKVSLTGQGEFLNRWLSDEDALDPQRSGPSIADPEGAGGAFKVLWQAVQGPE